LVKKWIGMVADRAGERDGELGMCVVVDNHIAGGVDSFVRTLIPLLSRLNPDLTLLVNSTYPALESLLERCPETTSVRSFSSVYHRRWFTRVGVEPRSTGVEKVLGAMRRVSELIVLPFEVLRLRRELPVPPSSVLVIVNGGYPGSYVALAAAMAFSKRHAVVMNIHGSAIPRTSLSSPMDRLLDGCVRRSVDLFVGVSRSSTSSLSQRMKGAGEKSAFVYNAVRPTSESALRSVDLDGVTDSGRFVMALVGAIDPQKGHYFALQVLAVLRGLLPHRELVLRFAGSDPFGRKDELLDVAEELGCLRELEFKDHEPDRCRLYSDMDLLLVPSTVQESFGLVAIEALSVGIPVVASSTGALPEILAGVPGARVMPELDIDDWAREIVRLVESPEHPPMESVRAHLARFLDPDAMALEYLEAIRSLGRRTQTDC
jgi:glycosyltransferase involved in cell wall biosynthesis